MKMCNNRKDEEVFKVQNVVSVEYERLEVGIQMDSYCKFVRCGLILSSNEYPHSLVRLHYAPNQLQR